MHFRLLAGPSACGRYASRVLESSISAGARREAGIQTSRGVVCDQVRPKATPWCRAPTSRARVDVLLLSNRSRYITRLLENLDFGPNRTAGGWAPATEAGGRGQARLHRVPAPKSPQLLREMPRVLSAAGSPIPERAARLPGAGGVQPSACLSPLVGWGGWREGEGRGDGGASEVGPLPRGLGAPTRRSGQAGAGASVCGCGARDGMPKEQAPMKARRLAGSSCGRGLSPRPSWVCGQRPAL